MKKIVAILTVLLGIISLVSGCIKKTSNTQNTISYEKVENMDFDFDVKPQTFEVILDMSGNKELISSPSEKRKVTNLEKTKDKISWSYPEETPSLNNLLQGEYGLMEEMYQTSNTKKTFTT